MSYYVAPTTPIPVMPSYISWTFSPQTYPAVYDPPSRNSMSRVARFAPFCYFEIRRAHLLIPPLPLPCFKRHTQDNALTTSKPPLPNMENRHDPSHSPFQLLHYSNSETHHKRSIRHTLPHTHPFENSTPAVHTKQILYTPHFKSERPTVQSLQSSQSYAIQSGVSMMHFTDIFSLILSFLGLYGIVFSLRLLLPRNVVPLVSTSLNEAMALQENAEAINIPNVSDYRVDLAILHNRFLQMRTESHRSPEFFQQVCLLFLYGLTWRLRSLKSEIEDIKRKIELAVDERQLASLTHARSATTTALPASAADAVVHMINVVEPARPPQASSSIPNAS